MTDQLVEILLVEDNPDHVELALHALEMYKVANRVHVAWDGADALNFLFGRNQYSERGMDNPPRVVLLDLKLPLVDGLDVLREIKADTRTRQIPVVVMTSSREEKDVVESYRLGVNSYIVKPVDFEQFMESMRTIGMYWLMINERPSAEHASNS